MKELDAILRREWIRLADKWEDLDASGVIPFDYKTDREIMRAIASLLDLINPKGDTK